MDEQKQTVKNSCLDAASNGIYWSVTEVLLFISLVRFDIANQLLEHSFLFVMQ